MLLSPRISTKQLANVCRRVATSLAAGLDARKVWAREADRSTGPVARGKFRAISDAVNRGASIREALEATGDYFPVLFRELAHVGDRTGHLDHAFFQLADHYDHQLKLRRGFLLAIAWPVIELGITIFVVGFLIWILGVIGNSTGTTSDVLGFGLVGTRGLMIYIAFLALVGAALFFAYLAISRGLVWTRFIQRGVVHVPVVGKAIECLALGRVAWALNLTLNAGMDTRRAVALSLKASRNARYTDHLRAIDADIAQGTSLFETFQRTGVFPVSFMDVVHVGEQTGMLVESMEKLAGQYRDEAEAAMRILAVAGFFAVFALIAAIIIALIFRIFSFYLGTLNDALKF